MKWKTWEGVVIIRRGFETSSFKPESFNERWWLQFDSDSVASKYYSNAGKLENIPGDDSDSNIKFYKPFTCRINGLISKPSRYGHLGGYTRRIKIQEITEIINEQSSPNPHPIKTKH